MGATALVPMLPVYIRHLGGSDALAGVVMASFFAAGVVSQYPIGRVADRVGRRPVLVAGLVAYGVASISFLLPITASMAIVLRAMQGLGAGAATVASLAMIASSVAVERRGRAFAAIYGGELAGMAVGPLVGSIVGIHYMWAMFLASALASFGACIPALRIHEPGGDAERRAARTRSDGTMTPLRRVRISRPMVGALICGATLGLSSGVYDICWTLLLLARGASGLEIGISWTLFAVPFVLVAKPSGWLADHMDRRALVLAGIGASTVLCASYPFIDNVPALVLLGALGGHRVRGGHACCPVAAHRGVGSLRGGTDPGHVRHQPDRVHRRLRRRRRSGLRHRLVVALRHRGLDRVRGADGGGGHLEDGARSCPPVATVAGRHPGPGGSGNNARPCDAGAGWPARWSSSSWRWVSSPWPSGWAAAVRPVPLRNGS